MAANLIRVQYDHKRVIMEPAVPDVRFTEACFQDVLYLAGRVAAKRIHYTQHLMILEDVGKANAAWLMPRLRDGREWLAGIRTGRALDRAGCITIPAWARANTT